MDYSSFLMRKKPNSISSLKNSSIWGFFNLKLQNQIKYPYQWGNVKKDPSKIRNKKTMPSPPPLLLGTGDIHLYGKSRKRNKWHKDWDRRQDIIIYRRWEGKTQMHSFGNPKESTGKILKLAVKLHKSEEWKVDNRIPLHFCLCNKHI